MKYREFMRMYRESDLTLREIARRVGVSVGTAKRWTGGSSDGFHTRDDSMQDMRHTDAISRDEEVRTLLGDRA
jgi:transcriptional regulator with XRE-family HTH domain